MGPRKIDIDILFYNDEVISTPGLTVPHPQIANRRFVLTPLNEIAPAFVHPALQKTILELLEICPDNLEERGFGSTLSVCDVAATETSSSDRALKEDHKAA